MSERSCSTRTMSVSYVRRVAQARLDLVHAESHRRERGDRDGDLSSELRVVLSQHLTGGPARPPRPIDDLSDDPLSVELDTICAEFGFSRLEELTEDELVSLGRRARRIRAARLGRSPRSLRAARHVQRRARPPVPRGRGVGRRVARRVLNGGQLQRARRSRRRPGDDAGDNDERQDRLLDLGAFIRSQRELARMSVRKLADVAGVSNPYLSQIERGHPAAVGRHPATARRGAADQRRVAVRPRRHPPAGPSSTSHRARGDRGRPRAQPRTEAGAAQRLRELRERSGDRLSTSERSASFSAAGCRIEADRTWRT